MEGWRKDLLGRRENGCMKRNPIMNEEGEMTIPLINRDAETYIDWEMKVDQVYKKVKMLTYKFIGDTFVWWNQFCSEI
ncbi:hypothetical protein CR513_30994, partial [Mucuna pruriens]